MNTFESFVKNGLSTALNSVGESAQIGSTKFKASFDESEMAVSRNTYGDEDEVTTTATLLKAAVGRKADNRASFDSGQRAIRHSKRPGGCAKLRDRAARKRWLGSAKA